MPTAALTTPTRPSMPRSLSVEQHRRIGALLGTPSCCVEQWLDPWEAQFKTAQGSRRGGLGMRIRTEEEREEIRRQFEADPLVAHLAGEWLDVAIAGASPQHRWVPCSGHFALRNAGTYEGVEHQLGSAEHPIDSLL